MYVHQHNDLSDVCIYVHKTDDVAKCEPHKLTHECNCDICIKGMGIRVHREEKAHL